MRSITRPQWYQWAALLTMAASGFAGLGYQIVWTQQCSLWLGHESAGVLAVVTAFFGGLAVGALVLGPRIEVTARPARWYAGCEFMIAAWTLLLAFVMPGISKWLLDLTGVQPTPVWQWTVAFMGTFCLLLPATAAMGATLPAMERLTMHLRDDTRSIAALYAGNTFGAVIGVLVSAFWLVPELGLQRTALLCVVLNVMCGLTSLWLATNKQTTPVGARHASTPLSTSASPSEIIGSRQGEACLAPTKTQRVLLSLAVTGLLGIGYEVLVVRVLSQVAEDTVYTFAMLLAAYLVGSTVGAACYEKWFSRRTLSKQLDAKLFCALAAACSAGTASLWFAEQVKAFALAQLGPSMSAAIAAEAVLALVAFGLPTIVMGMLFSHLSRRALDVGVSFGHAIGVNTLGAAAASLLFGVLAFPTLGPKFSLLLLACGYLALAEWRTWLTPLPWAPAAALLALAIWAPPLAFIDVPDGGHVVSYQEGVMAAVSVVEDANGVARLRIDNRQQEGSSATLRVDARQALLPLFLRPAPTRALFLGLGTGVTASSAAQFPGVQVDAVELLPEVVNASAHFRQAFSDRNEVAQPNLMTADARRYVRASNRSYDVIVSDNFHPARSGSGSLYTVEHFAAVKARLNSHGIFCQWLPLHQLDLDTLRSIVQSFLAVYPKGWAMLASNSLQTPVLGLVGRRDTERFDMEMLRNHLTSVVLPGKLSGIGIDDEFALLGSFVAGPEALQHFAGRAPLNTDDHPVVAYRAPRITYAPDSLPSDRLITLLAELSIEPNELIGPTSDTALPHRLAAYWNARNRFIELGRDVSPSANVRDMLAQVREPLLSVLRISPDFRPAYDPLLRMAMQQARIDAAGARVLLMELARIQPMRPEAASTLLQVDATL